MSFGLVTLGGNTELEALEVFAVSVTPGVSVVVAALFTSLSAPVDDSDSVRALVPSLVLDAWLVDGAQVWPVWFPVAEVAAVGVDV